MFAWCLLAALGRDDDADDDDEAARVQTGAILLAEGLSELTNIRKILQAVFKKE